MRSTLAPRTLAVVLAVLGPAVADAQVPKPPDLKSSDRSLVLQMRNGQVRVRDPDATKADRDARLAVLKKMAQGYAFGVAHPPVNGEPDTGKGSPFFTSLTSLMEDAAQLTSLSGPSSNGNKLIVEQIEFAEEFGAAIAEAVTVVLANSSRPIERVNAVRLLALAGRMPAPGVIDPCLDLIKNTQASDALKLYAFQALRNLIEQSRVDFPAQHVVRDVARMGQVHDALAAYVMQKRVPRDDKDRAVIEFVRRDAVAALARFKDAVLRKPNKDLVARPAWSLLRVIENDPAVSPPFTLQEMSEAAIGLGLMKPDPDMNLDVAAYSVAKGLSYFVSAAIEDGARSRAEGGPMPMMPWKIQSGRLAVALATWREATRPLGAAKGAGAVAEVAAKGIQVLGPIELQGAAQATTSVDAITGFLQNNYPKAWTDGTAPPGAPIPVYRDDPGPKLPFPAPMAAPTLKTPDGTVPPKKADANPPVKK